MSDTTTPTARLRFAPSGYLEQKPAPRQAWGQVSPDQPEGLAFARAAVPPGFLVIQNYLDPGTCDRIVAECAQLPGVASTVADGKGDDYRDQVRRSDYIQPGSVTGVDVMALMKDVVANTVGPLLRVEPEWYEQPEILRYPQGGEFLPHADADVFDPATQKWDRRENRDISLLLYLNDGFQGGEIQFPNFGLSLPPRRGMLVAFPSDGRYAHAARPVGMGQKYVVVTWLAAKGSPRVGKDRAGVIRL